MRTGGLVRVIAFLLSVPPAAGQGPVADRLRGRVPPEVAAAVERLAREAAAQGLPVEPLVQKAVEGGAKGVPGPRVVAAVEALAARLESAARAVRAGGATPDPATIEAAAFVLSLGLGETQVARLVQVGRPGRDRAVVLRVAGALVALGVPAGESVDLLVGELEAGRPEAELVDLPARVQAGLGRGLTPAEAARAAGTRRGGPPPGVPAHPPRGRPEAKPPRPPQGAPGSLPRGRP